MKASMSGLQIVIRGRVQGVGFRFAAMEAAYKYSILGFVKNQGSDSVFICAEGDPERLDQFVAWCRKGPFGAKVESVEMITVPVRHFRSFEIVSRDHPTG